MNKTRWQEQPLLKALNSRRIIILSGARQSGKTTLAKQIVRGNLIYRTLDDATLLKAAQVDAQGFIKLNKGTMIIDEIQRVPELITAIKKAVDENPRYGQYLITGSVNIQTLPSVRESLAGRVKKIRLRPFSQGEILNKKPMFLKRLQDRDFVQNEKYDKHKILEMIFKGGFPEPAMSKGSKENKSWYIDYINTLIEYDLADIANIKRQDYLKELIVVMAAFSSKFIDKSKITSNLGLSVQTLDSYLNILENMYIIERVHPWVKSDYQRVNRQDKFFMSDSGLMSSVLNWKLEDVFLDSDKSGKVFETFVYNQLIAHIELQDYEYSLYHYRDREKREIDFIIENDDKEIILIEVKAGSSVKAESFKHMTWFKNNLAKDKNVLGIVLYTGENVVPFGENFYAIPMNNLWD